MPTDELDPLDAARCRIDESRARFDAETLRGWTAGRDWVRHRAEHENLMALTSWCRVLPAWLRRAEPTDCRFSLAQLVAFDLRGEFKRTKVSARRFWSAMPGVGEAEPSDAVVRGFAGGALLEWLAINRTPKRSKSASRTGRRR